MVELPGPARIVSLNVGSIQELSWRGRSKKTGIDKRPVSERLAVERLGIRGDVQVDRRYHGGVDKAVYGYASEHHPYWSDWLGREVGPGAFGENLTLEGVLDDQVHIGDRLWVGSALLEVSQPRQPCSTFAAFHQRSDLPRAFAEAEWPGIYLRVIEEGAIAPGDPVEREVVGSTWTVQRVFRLVMGRESLPDDLDDLLALPALAESCRTDLVSRRRARSGV